MPEDTPARGLRAYLDQKGAAMRAAAQGKPDGDDWRETVTATCRADDATGVRKLRMGDWRLTGDSGPSFGGWGLGPSSPELLCGVISTCLTHTYLIAAAARGVPLDAVEVTVSADNNDARLLGLETSDPALPFNITARVQVTAPDASPDSLTALHAYVRDTCPLTQLVRQANEITIVVEE